MEALQLKTVQDLLASPDERVELIGGEIVRRPMTRARHGRVQRRVSRDLGPYDDGPSPGGWWIMTEISVAYDAHECPSHDLAGWRRERLPRLPDGPIDLPPDWVCEIVSPGHEKKDTLTIPLLLRRHRVPHYWLIWPEDRTLVAYGLDDGEWSIIATLKESERGRVPPFEAVELDLGAMLAID
jgi:Uma2 family endonuclease